MQIKMKNIYRILTFVACIGLFTQCEPDGEFDHPINQDNFPDVPVLFPGSTTFGANPYYQVAFQAGAAPITINVSIPTDAPLKIKEITKVIAGTTSITPGNVTTASVANYLAAPIVVNGTTATISTSLTEFNTKMPTASRVTQAAVDAAAVNTPATPYVERAFMLLITLEDNTTIITQQVRLRVVK
jgi:hypothetical protein